MKKKVVASMTLAGLVVVSSLAAPVAGQAQETPQVKIPEPGVPQVMTMEGRFVRAAYNNEGYVILGYRAANKSVGDEWLLLEVGMTVRDGVPNYTLKRDALSIETPDGKTVPLASLEDYRKGNLRALENRAKVQRDSINYFPPGVSRGCRIGFFAELGAPVMSWDQVELSDERGCLGRLFFQVPGGITHGQYWLNAKFKDTLVRVPFRILTDDEYKLLDKNYKDIDRQVKAAFAPPKKKK
jgi:hypothetical protein